MTALELVIKLLGMPNLEAEVKFVDDYDIRTVKYIEDYDIIYITDEILND
jgi:hypothetical protein